MPGWLGSGRIRVRRAGAPVLGTALCLAALSACGPPPVPDFPIFEVTVPDPAAVDEVMFFIGDAGNAVSGRSPLLADLAGRVEFWSGAIARDSSVTVVFLGDNVYPVGLRDPDHPAFPTDSTHLWSQIEILAGPEALRRGSVGLFLAGNHDWGNMVGSAGVERLDNQVEQLALARAQGIRVRFIPEPGDPGPEVVDLRRNTRVIGIDTHWFLQSTSQTRRDEFLERILTAIQEAEDRHIVFVAHHPWESAGEHGALQPAGEALGLLFLLKKSGTLVQDLNSPIYLELRRRLRTAFTAAERTPLVYAAGHDHSLQVIQSKREFEPRFQIVSGAGSKNTDIGTFPGLEWAGTNLGYMMLFLLKDQSVRLFVVSTDSDRLICPEEPEADRLACMEEETARYALRYSQVLAEPASLPEPPDVAAGRDTVRP